MAARSGPRDVSLSTAALETLRQIWTWNAAQYGPDHADGYLTFLEREIETLVDSETVGRPVLERPEYRYLLMKRRTARHGHLAVFQVHGNQVRVLQIFHTAQDWSSALPSNESGG